MSRSPLGHSSVSRAAVDRQPAVGQQQSGLGGMATEPCNCSCTRTPAWHRAGSRAGCKFTERQGRHPDMHPCTRNEQSTAARASTIHACSQKGAARPGGQSQLRASWRDGDRGSSVSICRRNVGDCPLCGCNTRQSAEPPRAITCKQAIQMNGQRHNGELPLSRRMHTRCAPDA